MVDMMNWFLLFFRDSILTLFSIQSLDGYSLGYMVLAIAIIGVVVSATIGAVALLSHSIERYSMDMHNDKIRKG